MQVTINQTTQTFNEGMRLGDIITACNLKAQGIAVALNDSVIPQSQWADTPVHDGDHVLIITATAGG